MEPSRTQPIPLYYQLKTLLLEEILGGRYGTAGQLPTEHELCARFEISRTPVTRALSELAEEGVILRHRRRGTFVNPHWLQRRSGAAELRVLAPESGSPWERHLASVACPEMWLSTATVDLNDLHSTFVHAVAEGRAPDLAILDSVWVAEFAASGFLYPLEELDAEWVHEQYEQDFLQPFVDAHRFAGSTLAVQAEMDVAGLWYRRDDLATLGLDPPATWDDLKETARALHKSGGRRHAFLLSAGSRADEAATYCLVTLLASNGAGVLNEHGVTLASEASVQAMRFLRGMVDEGLLPVDVVTYERTRPVQMLADGRTPLCMGGSYEGAVLAERAGLAIGEVPEVFGFVPMPAGPQGRRAVLAGGMVYGVPRQAERPKLAMDLLETAVSAGALTRMCAPTGQIPPRRSAVTRLAPDSAFHSDIAGMLDLATVRPVTRSYALVSAQLRAMGEAVLTRRLEPEAAVARAADLIGAITGLPVVKG